MVLVAKKFWESGYILIEGTEFGLVLILQTIFVTSYEC
jgi:hypothetical protein